MKLCAIDGCGKPNRARGWCSAHWLTWRKHGTARYDYTAARFWSKVRGGDVATCWEWVAGRGSHGYGVFYTGGHQVMAHRWAYEHLIAPIPVGLQADHLCFNRGCVNPWHIEPVTSRINTLRSSGPSAVNARKSQCPAGHPYDAENTSLKPDGRRVCRACARASAAKRRAAA